MKIKLLLVIICAVLLSAQDLIAQEKNQEKTEMSEIADNEKLVVLWTSGDVEVAKKMVYMYTYNAKKHGWWKEITFIIWGPSSKLLSEDSELQDYVKKMTKEGIKFEACKACSDMYDVSDKLIELGIDVKYMGTGLTEYIKSEQHVITF